MLQGGPDGDDKLADLEALSVLSLLLRPFRGSPTDRYNCPWPCAQDQPPERVPRGVDDPAGAQEDASPAAARPRRRHAQGGHGPCCCDRPQRSGRPRAPRQGQRASDPRCWSGAGELRGLTLVLPPLRIGEPSRPQEAREGRGQDQGQAREAEPQGPVRGLQADGYPGQEGLSGPELDELGCHLHLLTTSLALLLALHQESYEEMFMKVSLRIHVQPCSRLAC